ncbi:MAG TPA: glucoamylase family protein [Verrucomicrobiae bacterium]|jgi:hypothetical protein|nr:glucoamylase family protein [Verrucomicrobiae bacterium]
MHIERNLVLGVFLWAVAFAAVAQPVAPTNVVIFSGDQSVILHWDPDASPNVSGYNVSRALSSTGPFTQRNSGLLTALGYCDLSVSDGLTYYYQVTAVNASSQTSPPSATAFTTPNHFASDNAFMDYLEEANFDFFWYTANPANGLIPDRSTGGAPDGSACSIFSVGLGLTAIGIAVDHGWITRTQGAARVLTTLNTFWNGPQGPNATGDIGYNGWFYHFLDMNAATRSGSSELSSIDSTFLLAGILYSKQYFNGTNATETSIQTEASAIFNRVNWLWFAPDVPGTNAVRMGWLPGGSGFSTFGDWQGYNEGMLLYLLGMGATSNTLPADCWSYWTSGYAWATEYGESYIVFPPLYGYEYSHCWVDFRHIGDAYMNAENSTYFENSHRAALAQQAYCIANPGGWKDYSADIWGLTASDDPSGYAVHGAPPAENDDGTIAPTAAGGAMSFAPEIALPTLEYFYSLGRTKLWTAYGFIDAFNFSTVPVWYDTDELGLDQGPIVISTENYRNQNVWRLFMLNPEIQRGLQQAGFVALPFEHLAAQAQPAQGTVTLTWPATVGRTYQVEYSTNLFAWFTSPTQVTATNSTASWTDTLGLSQRFYQVYQYGTP